MIDRAPAANTWWLQPADDDARAWAAEHPASVTQGCVEGARRLLVPPGKATS